MPGLVNGVYEATTATSGTLQDQYLKVDNGTNIIGHFCVNGTPEGVIAANIGSQAIDATNGDLYIKKTDTANTGWGRILNNQSGWITVNNGAVWNLSFSISAGVLTVAGADGTALSATNPAFVTMKSNVTQGRLVQHVFTSNVTLTATDMDGNIFGTTASVAWATELPFYVGVMASATDTNPVFVMMRLPNILKSPAAAGDIGDPSAANADTELSVFSFSDITEADYTSKNLCTLGVVLVSSKSAADAWTLSTSSGASPIGEFYSGYWFNMSISQYGATTGGFMKANGGTAPVFATIDYRYTISQMGDVRCAIGLESDGGTDGATAVESQIILPVSSGLGLLSSNTNIGSGFSDSITGGKKSTSCVIQAIGNTYFQLIENDTDTFVLNSDFTNGYRAITIGLNYSCRSS